METDWLRAGAAKLLAQAAQNIDQGLLWAATPEGTKYWAEVNDRLKMHAAVAAAEKGSDMGVQALGRLTRRLPTVPPQMGEAVELEERKDFAAQARERMEKLGRGKQHSGL